jgi:hypothetical protein
VAYSLPEAATLAVHSRCSVSSCIAWLLHNCPLKQCSLLQLQGLGYGGHRDEQRHEPIALRNCLKSLAVQRASAASLCLQVEDFLVIRGSYKTPMAACY